MNLFEMPKIGIVGLGFVGSAIQNSYDSYNLVLVDPAKGHTGTFEDLMDCEGVFICVPSPQSEDGSCDTSILESVLEKLKDYKGVIISKCTVPPLVYERLGKQYPNLVQAPEFLTAANAVSDYLNGKFAIIGGSVGAYQRDAERLIRGGQVSLENVIHCSLGEASLAKYTINSFLATKVVFMNELHNLANQLGLDYKKVSQMISLDDRIGKSHLKVPGPDGAFGFGGMCFPKDTSALLKFAEEASCQMNVLESAVKKNTLLRLTEPK
jgi:UDPglucose 6-dehydrogenase